MWERALLQFGIEFVTLNYRAITRMEYSKECGRMLSRGEYNKLLQKLDSPVRITEVTEFRRNKPGTKVAIAVTVWINGHSGPTIVTDGGNFRYRFSGRLGCKVQLSENDKERITAAIRQYLANQKL